MASIETVKIVSAKNAKGWRIINKCDMKPEDKLYMEPTETAQQAPEKTESKKGGKA